MLDLNLDQCLKYCLTHILLLIGNKGSNECTKGILDKGSVYPHYIGTLLHRAHKV